MLVRVDDSFELAFEKSCYIEFASVSCVGGDTAEVSVFLNDELHDRVHVNVPHSWWKNAGQQIVARNPVAGDVLKITTDKSIDVRLDVIEP